MHSPPNPKFSFRSYLVPQVVDFDYSTFGKIDVLRSLSVFFCAIAVPLHILVSSMAEFLAIKVFVSSLHRSFVCYKKAKIDKVLIQTLSPQSLWCVCCYYSIISVEFSFCSSSDQIMYLSYPLAFFYSYHGCVSIYQPIFQNSSSCWLSFFNNCFRKGYWVRGFGTPIFYNTSQNFSHSIQSKLCCNTQNGGRLLYWTCSVFPLCCYVPLTCI